jgi:hypothetical protein
MKSIYFENDDILQIRMSEKQIVREVSQDWHTNISYPEDGSIVEIVLLDAKKEGLLPLEYRKPCDRFEWIFNWSPTLIYTRINLLINKIHNR